MKFFSLLIFGLALACSSNSSERSYDLSKAESANYVYADDEYLEEVEEAPIEGNLSAKPIQQEQKIIKTAQLRFSSEDPDETHQKILLLARRLEGFIQSDNAGKNYNEVYRDMIIRIPTNNFQAFVDGLSSGVTYFDQKDISRRDVTEEFVDLNARLNAKKELEARYLELLKQARNVKEMLEIERELANIREEIEAKQGRLNYLQNKVSLSTININFYKRTSETGVTLSYGQKMKNAFKGGWDGISVFFLGILYLWPLFLLAIIITLTLRWFIRKRRKKSSAN